MTDETIGYQTKGKTKKSKPIKRIRHKQSFKSIGWVCLRCKDIMFDDKTLKKYPTPIRRLSLEEQIENYSSSSSSTSEPDEEEDLDESLTEEAS
jgi:hypothetical protein